ncbi:MAG TPA: DUF4288 domain-containing protein [Gemmataceae bacterium]|jgi:hypothetical protein|nr:DUF4288 domain-containing protein [Gemmataceae bacterium]
MSWFAAHLIMSVRLKAKQQRRFPVWENIVLIQADSEKQAFQKAERRGRLDEGDDDGTFTWGDHPAIWVFAGVRKLTPCEDSQSPPSDGTEISFLEFELDSEETVRKFVEGQQVKMQSNERFAGSHRSKARVSGNHGRRKLA